MNKKLCKRLGFTLIETLLAVSFGSSIMLTSVALVHTSFRLHGEAQQRAEQALTLARFTEQFRRDCYMASDAWAASANSLSLTLEVGSQVTYTANQRQLTRALLNPDDGIEQVERVELNENRRGAFSLKNEGRCAELKLYSTVEAGLAIEHQQVWQEVQVALRLAHADVANKQSPIEVPSPSDVVSPQPTVSPAGEFP